MKVFKKSKDGGPESPVEAYFLCEFKGMFSIAILKFNKGGRENYHSHAFDALTWFWKGHLIEYNLHAHPERYRRGLLPKVTTRNQIHRVHAYETSWCLTIRGPWHKYWKEYNEKQNETIVFTHGREVIYREKLFQKEPRAQTSEG